MLTTKETKVFSLVKEYVKDHDILVSYLRNEYGYTVGVVVAIGKDKVGWSMVNMSEDYEYKNIQPHQLPVVQFTKTQAEKEGVSFNMYELPAVKKLIRNDLMQKIPHFNKEEGLRRAIECAENGKVVIIDEDDEGEYYSLSGKVPLNSIMVKALVDMIRRSRNVKRFK